MLGDQGLACVSSAVVMSRQDNWNEKHSPPFNEVRLSKNRMRMKVEKGWRLVPDRDNAESIWSFSSTHDDAPLIGVNFE